MIILLGVFAQPLTEALTNVAKGGSLL